MKKKVLVTGASGFIGSFLVEGGLERGMEVWAGIRNSSSRIYLQDKRIHFAELNLTSEKDLIEQLSIHKTKHGKWDYIIHCAGVTKASNQQAFDRGNFDATRYLVDALHALDMIPEKFLFISSLSVVGAIREEDYQPITNEDNPEPNTAYGRSKWKAEQYLQSLAHFPYVTFRPTGVYGPREKDYFLMAKSVKQHLDFSVGFKQQIITFVYVKDLVQAVYLATEHNIKRKTYLVSDGMSYSSRAFSDLIQKELDILWVAHITCPLFLLKCISLLAEKGAKLLGKVSTLNGDKYKIMKQRNWQCDITPLVRELGYTPKYLLADGVKESIAWYKENRWI
ncbi:MAG: NAD-dependent epimerase/dehydratase family protein [Phocaeicola sp.]